MEEELAQDDGCDEALYYFERAQLAVGQAAKALRDAREALEAVVPPSFYAALVPALKEIEGLSQAVLPRESESPVMDQPYRDGLLCSIDGIGYWHTGAQYWIAVGSAGGPQEDLREYPGFDKVDSQFEKYSAVLYGSTWREAGEADVTIATALDLLRARGERLWWVAVVDFLRAYKGLRVDRELARRTLLENGFDAVQVARLLPE